MEKNNLLIFGVEREGATGKFSIKIQIFVSESYYFIIWLRTVRTKITNQADFKII